METTRVTKADIIAAYQSRHATKVFDPTRKITDEDFDFILETGRLSPSSFGFEPWQFVVVQNDAIRERIRGVSWGAQRSLPTASHFIVLLTRTAPSLLPDSPYITNMMEQIQQLPPEVAAGKRQAYRNFLESDFQLLQDDRYVFEWASRQTYIALGNMLTAAALIGIDSCPIEGFVLEDLNRVLEEEGLLDPDQFRVSAMAAFGYRAQEPRNKTRRPSDSVVQWVR
ncbi:putative NAD(P)H nitroreductase YfkO [Paenibacillus sp. CCS19]|uniref:NAD(P)H-dependent oxidoreductase n=1 Tax=Paenibacillus sp. CCS19 TaxID=3158387 RepID=UPI00255FFCA4|nr:NAD(P)H-dependent oxidoreductase [Paenibacillus cellulosilyticus]GMK41778.1 putative NAD(P)H nitroreductase YfkO [Paenibacillus cellulosilyticus]